MNKQAGFPGSPVVPSCQCKRHGFDPRVRKIPLEKGMATHSSILAWEILWREESVRLLSMGLQRVRHNLATKTTTTASLFIFDICPYTKEESRERCFGEGLTHTKLHVIFSLKAGPPYLPTPNHYPITSRTNHENLMRNR